MTEQQQPATVFEWLGGEAGIQTLVMRFYDLMDLERARQHLFWFLCGWSGGPDYFVERFGHPRLKARHLPFKIGIRERDQWVACMDQAMGEVGVDLALHARLNDSFFQTADWMRNVGA